MLMVSLGKEPERSDRIINLPLLISFLFPNLSLFHTNKPSMPQKHEEIQVLFRPDPKEDLSCKNVKTYFIKSQENQLLLESAYLYIWAITVETHPAFVCDLCNL